MHAQGLRRAHLCACHWLGQAPPARQLAIEIEIGSGSGIVGALMRRTGSALVLALGSASAQAVAAEPGESAPTPFPARADSPTGSREPMWGNPDHTPTAICSDTI